MLHLVDVVKARRTAREAGRLIDTYVVHAESASDAVKSVVRALEAQRRDEYGTAVVHRLETNAAVPLVISANREVTLGVLEGIRVAAKVTHEF